MMNEEGSFSRLLELIRQREHEDLGLHRMLLELLYEMSRIQRIQPEDLSRFASALATYIGGMVMLILRTLRA